MLKTLKHPHSSIYKGRSFNCVTGVLQGALLVLTILLSFEPVNMFSLDRNAVSSL